MNKYRILFLFYSFLCTVVSFAHIDTLYYDSNWKGVPSKGFAFFYRIVSDTDDPNYPKMYRNFYNTGELQSEGEYIYIDKYDDSKSIFNGSWKNFYKSGKIEQEGTCLFLNKVDSILLLYFNI